MHNSCSSIVLHPCRRVRFFGIGRGGGGVLAEEEEALPTGLDDAAASDELLLPIACVITLQLRVSAQYAGVGGAWGETLSDFHNYPE